MVVYWVNDGYNGPAVECADVKRETKQFYFLSDWGPGYCHRFSKSDIGKTIHLSHNAAITAFEQRWLDSVQHAKEMVESRSKNLESVQVWARQNKIEESQANAQQPQHASE